jgi:hypothetical protein
MRCVPTNGATADNASALSRVSGFDVIDMLGLIGANQCLVSPDREHDKDRYSAFGHKNIGSFRHADHPA